jgi:hypothetical protein
VTRAFVNHEINHCRRSPSIRRSHWGGGTIAIRVQNLSKCYSVCSWLVCNFLHPKPVDFGQDPLALGTTQSGRKSFDANLAISTILFERSSRHFHDVYSTLKKLRHHRLAFSAYPLSGGFERPFFIPTWMMRPVLTIEHVLRALSRYLAFRILVVLEQEFH